MKYNGLTYQDWGENSIESGHEGASTRSLAQYLYCKGGSECLQFKQLAVEK